MDTLAQVDFLVTVTPASGRRPVIGLDGPVQGADLCFDHHATGDPVNLVTIPILPPVPGTLVTTMLDSDAVISAAVLLLRATDQGAPVHAAWPTLYEAAHYCDHLIPSGQHPLAEDTGLGLHLWLKDRGLTMGEVMAWGRAELRAGRDGAPQVSPSPTTQSRVFAELTWAMVAAIRLGKLPSDVRYLERLEGMVKEARYSVVRKTKRVTLLAPEGFIDPLALYRVVDTDIAVRASRRPSGAWGYSIGVHPRAYRHVDLRPILRALHLREPGWGGRANAGGSPSADGSRIEPGKLVEILDRAVP